jgi:hypothetical protein
MILALLILLSTSLEEPAYSPPYREVQVVESVRGLTDEQLHQVKIIEEIFDEVGLDDNIIAAAIVNAFAESRLDPTAVGDKGASVGLFQLHERGLGHGLTDKYRKNPYLNAQVVAIQIKKNKKLVWMAAEGATIPQLAAEFSTQIMRPKYNKRERSKRWRMAQDLFPTTI